MIIRIYQDKALQVNQEIELDTRATNHLVNVLRAKVGDDLILFNGKGGEYNTTIKIIEKRRAIVTITAFNDISRESPFKIHLAQVISRQEKMDLTIQKAAELGVAEITPLLSEKCGVKLKDDRLDKKLERWQQIIISACEQCGRNQLPKLNTIVDFDTFIKQNDAYKIILEPTAHETLKSITPSKAITVLIGPESGFSETEIKTAKQHNTHAITLGPRILRTETAGLAIVSILQSQFGDL